MTAATNWLLYDGECPFCTSYARHARLRAALGQVLVADAHRHPALVAEAMALGMDVDLGMVLKLDGRYYFGGDCLHRIALLTTPSGALNRLNRALFRSAGFTRLVYPVLRGMRNAALALLGRRKIATRRSAP